MNGREGRVSEVSVVFAVALLTIVGWPVAGHGSGEARVGRGAPAPQPQPISAADFRVDKINDHMLRGEILKTLGKPIREKTEPNPFAGDYPLHLLKYEGLEVVCLQDGKVLGLSLTGREWKSARGIRVGDSAVRVREKYGVPTAKDRSTWEYADPANQESLHAIRFEFRDGWVKSIYVGSVLD